MILTEALKLILKALFIVNNEYIPHEKWMIHMTSILPWLPNNWDIRITQAMSAINQNSYNLKKKQTIITYIHLNVEQYLDENYKSHTIQSMKSKNENLTNHHSKLALLDWIIPTLDNKNNKRKTIIKQQNNILKMLTCILYVSSIIGIIQVQ